MWRKLILPAVLASSLCSPAAMAGGELNYTIIDWAGAFFAGRDPADLPPQYRNHCGFAYGKFYWAPPERVLRWRQDGPSKHEQRELRRLALGTVRAAPLEPIFDAKNFASEGKAKGTAMHARQ